MQSEPVTACDDGLMPKPVKKADPKKKTTAERRPSSDPNRRAHQLIDAHLDKLSRGKWATSEPDVTPPHGDPFEEQFRKRMSELGRKGGKTSGAKRMEMPKAKRKAIAKKAAAARWSKRESR